MLTYSSQKAINDDIEKLKEQIKLLELEKSKLQFVENANNY